MNDRTSIDWWLVVLSTILVITATTGLRITTLATAQRFVTSAATVGTVPMSQPSPDRVGRAVSTVWRRFPPTTCLTAAIACHAILTAYGYDSQLRIGVRRTDSELQAHAWVEHDNTVVVSDGDDPSTYNVLTSDQANPGVVSILE